MDEESCTRFVRRNLEKSLCVVKSNLNRNSKLIQNERRVLFLAVKRAKFSWTIVLLPVRYCEKFSAKKAKIRFYENNFLCFMLS